MTQMAKDSFKATSKIERDIDIYFKIFCVNCLKDTQLKSSAFIQGVK